MDYIEATIEVLRQQWHKMHASKWQLQKLLGRLRYVARAIKPARLSLARLLENLRHLPDTGEGPLSPGFYKDIA